VINHDDVMCDHGAGAGVFIRYPTGTFAQPTRSFKSKTTW